MKVETGVAEMRDGIAKLVQRASAPAQGRGHFDAFAKVETLQRGLSRKMRKRRAKLADEAAQIASQSGDGSVAAMLEPCQQLSECAGRLVADSREIGNGDEVERGFNCVHARASSHSAKNSIISSSSYRRNDPRCS